MKSISISLFKPHRCQKQVIRSLENSAIFFVVLVAGRQIGKSVLGMNMALKWATDTSNQVIYWVSPTDNQAHKVYKQIVSVFQKTGIIKSKKGGKGDTEIVFINGSRILFRSAASEDSLRGESVNYMILDECAFIKTDTVNTILLPMLNVKGKKCLAISTPKGKNWLYDWYNRGQDALESKWKSFRFSSYDSPYVNEDLIDEARHTMPEKQFQQEIEAQFIDSSSVFDNLTDLLVLDDQTDPVEGEKYYAGIDIGLVNDASVISILNEQGHLVKYYRYHRLSSPDLINNIIEVNEKWKFKRILIENNNQGLPIYQELKRVMNNINEMNTNTKSKPEMIHRLIHLFKMKQMLLVADDYLRMELEAFVFIQSDSGHMKFKSDNGFNDDCVMSLAIARECYERYKYDSRYVGFF